MENGHEPETIGIMGIGHGCGATHFAVLLANYLAGVEQMKTALAACGSGKDLEKLARICTGEAKEGFPNTILDVDYFLYGTKKELQTCIQGGYDVVLLDLGSSEEGRQTEFLQCRRQYIIGSLNEWKLEEVFRQKAWLISGKERWQFFMIFGSEEARREIRRRFGLCFERIPFAPDSFSIDRTTAEFFRKIWKKKK